MLQPEVGQTDRRLAQFGLLHAGASTDPEGDVEMTSTTSTTRTHRQGSAAPARRVRLTDLPLVAARLRCGHLVREHGIAVRDIVFCPGCGSQSTVASVIAQ